MYDAWRVLVVVLFLIAPGADARDLQPAPRSVAPKSPQAASTPLVCDRDAQSAWPHKTAEARCLAGLSGLAERTDDVLTLQLENGTSRSFQDAVSGCNPPQLDFAKCILYRLVASYPAEHLFVIDVAFYECGYIIVLDRKTGYQIKHSATPRRSPRGQRFVAVDSSESCPHSYDIAIWSAADPTKLEWQYTQPSVGQERWEFVRWDDDNRIVLKVETRGPKSALTTIDAEAILTNKGWQLYRPDRRR